MARITGVSPRTRNPLLRLLFCYARRRFGRDASPLFGYATNGPVLASLLALEVGMERAHRLDETVKKLAELRVAALVGCPFCLDIGSVLVRESGVPERKLRELNDHATSDAFTPLEKAALAWADRMTATPVVPPPMSTTAPLRTPSTAFAAVGSSTTAVHSMPTPSST